MSERRSKAKARRGIRKRWMPSVLSVTLGLALVVGLAGLAFGTYIFSGHQLVGQSSPSVAVPLPSGAVGGVAGAANAEDTAAASTPTDSPQPSDTSAPSTPSAPSTQAAQIRTVTNVTAKGGIATTVAAASSSPAQATPASNTSPASTVASTPASTVASTPASSVAATSVSSFEQQVLALTNAQRTAAGCQALTWNATLASVARAHSQDMAANNYFDHNSPSGTTPAQRLSAAGYTYTLMAENIAAGQATPTDVMTSWMNSAGHRANILNCSLTELGVGYATGGTYGTYWTQDFGTP